MERSWLESLLARGYSLERIGELAAKHHSTVGYWIKKHGLEAAHCATYAPKGGFDEEALRRLVGNGLSLASIARELGVSVSTARYWLDRFGLRTRQAERTEAYRVARSAALPEIEMTCARHGHTSFRRHTSGRYRCARCTSDGVAKRRRKVKETIVREAGGRCQICGYDRYQGALQFHHVDPNDKVFAVGHDGTTRSLDRMRRETSKCVLLCGNCHAEVEAGVTALTSVRQARLHFDNEVSS
jgi:transposase-like protein